MQLYNTLTKQQAELKPQQPPAVTIYTCGPTVYDYPHIGNWFTFVRYDLLVRTLKASGYEPLWVMNITDVGHLVSDADEGEDKLEKGAKREGKSAWEVAHYYTEYFKNGLRRLNMLEPEHMPKATNHVPEQVELIQKLEAKGFTYIIDDGVYYDTAKFKDYEKFAQLDLDEQQSGERVEQNPQKHRPSDFALWKLSPKDHQRDMEWDSPWGKGFPGWHIECSAMSLKYLGETLDIHSGGIDHIPVHHTNEIAQSEAATGKRLANVWMHTNHITVEGEKIAKSAGNGITLEEIEGKGISLPALRLHILESHYRSQSKFSWESLSAAQNRLRDYTAMADLRWQTIESAGIEPSAIEKVYTAVLNALQNDLSTPEALAALSAFSNVVQEKLLSKADHEAFTNLLTKLDELLGLQLSRGLDIMSEQKAVLAQRATARDKKDWAESDTLRDTLKLQKLEVRDTPHGQIWSRV